MSGTVSGAGRDGIVLATAWAALVLAVACRFRPPPPRVRALGAAGPRARVGIDVAGAVGSAVLRAVTRAGPRRWRGAAAGTPPRPVGAAVLAAAACLPIAPAAAPLVAVIASALPVARGRRTERRRLAALAADLPDVVDLLLLGVDAGLTVPLALGAVARRGTGPLAAEISRVLDEVALGRRLADALDDLPRRAGEATRPLAAALLASERYGAPLAAGLVRLGDDVRSARRRRAEEAARRLPVKLLFPLVTCALPAFALLTVVPLVAGAVGSLRL